jgi:hypothetical protein
MTITVPPDRVARLTEAVHHLLESASEASDPSFDRLADDLRSGRRASTSIVVSAPRTELREVLHVALDEAGEMLAGACTALLRGRGSLEEVRSRLAELLGLVDLLERIEAGG